MTFREKLQMRYPGRVKEGEKIKECLEYYEFAGEAECINDCEKCWDRVIPGTEDKMMTRDDLKDGMVCELRNGGMFIWWNGMLRNFTNYCQGTDVDLKDEDGEEEFDIMKVYTTNAQILNEMMDRDTLTIIWERKETKEMTIAEIEKALGHPVKIIGDSHESDQ
jgi:hypothetical protein|nr:MAG TPA: hypothetical protein [Caudoviricetes sp.]